MPSHSSRVILGWAVTTCSTSYLFMSGSIQTPFSCSTLWSSEPGSGVSTKNSSMSSGSSFLMISISCRIDPACRSGSRGCSRRR